MQAKQKLTGYALDRLFEQMRGGAFAVRYKDGSPTPIRKREPRFTVRLNDDEVLDLVGDDLLTSFGEAYMDGRVDVEGDLADLLSLALQSGLMSVTQKTPGFAGSGSAGGRQTALAQTREGKHRPPLRSRQRFLSPLARRIADLLVRLFSKCFGHSRRGTYKN